MGAVRSTVPEGKLTLDRGKIVENESWSSFAALHFDTARLADCAAMPAVQWLSVLNTASSEPQTVHEVAVE